MLLLLIVFVVGTIAGGDVDGDEKVVSAKRMSSKSTSKGSAIRDKVVHFMCIKKKSVYGVVKVM